MNVSLRRVSGGTCGYPLGCDEPPVEELTVDDGTPLRACGVHWWLLVDRSLNYHYPVKKETA